MEINKTKGARRLFGKELDTKVFWGSVALTAPFLVVGIISPKILGQVGNAALGYLTSSWSWFYLVSVSLFAFLCLVLALSPLGKVKLGRDDEKPEFSMLSWFAMLFSAGMGIGLVFWSIAEPMYHFTGPPVGRGGTPEAANQAFTIFFFHWGLHAWGTYVIVGLPLAYFKFRKQRPATVSQCLTPLTGSDGTGLFSKMIDSLAIWATIMGVVTSLGLGALQITRGLAFSFGLPGGKITCVIVIGVITLLFVASALSGVNRGIKFLSLANVFLMVLLLLVFMVFGPGGYIIKTFGRALADYAVRIIPMSTSLELFGNPEWTSSWTVFYWAWWVAWAPFVGAFIAGISKGRTIREFVICVMVLPALFSFVFSTALGGTAIHMEMVQGIPISAAVQKSADAALFETLHHLPSYTLLVILANILIASFFITSADSATLVISHFSTGGVGAGSPRNARRLIVFWGLLLAALVVVLIFSGGLKALQTASIIGAFPFLIIMYLLYIAIVKDLIESRRKEKSGSGNSMSAAG